MGNKLKIREEAKKLNPIEGRAEGQAYINKLHAILIEAGRRYRPPQK